MSDRIDVSRFNLDKGAGERMKAAMSAQGEDVKLEVTLVGKGVLVNFGEGRRFGLTFVGAKCVASSLLECLVEAKKRGFISADDLKLIEGYQ